MLLATLLLSALLSPQAPPAAEEEMPPPVAADPLAAVDAAGAPPSSESSVSAHIDAGLKAFRRRRFSAARDEFEKAAEADPQSAAAAFYLGYVHYKLAEPSRRLTPEKQQAKELFARAYRLDPAFMPVWGTSQK